MEDERLYKELKVLEAERPKIEERKRAFISKARDLVIDLNTARAILDSGDPLLQALEKSVQDVRNKIGGDEEAWRMKHKELCRQMEALTGPEIASSIERLNLEVSGLKLEEKTLGRTSGGFSFTPRIILMTNRTALLEIKRIASEGKEELAKMRHEPIPAIRGFGDSIIKKIRAIDTSPKRGEVDEFAFESQQFAYGGTGR